eukprot:1161075-Pelagomonas_calceolata.AAC.13
MSWSCEAEGSSSSSPLASLLHCTRMARPTIALQKVTQGALIGDGLTKSMQLPHASASPYMQCNMQEDVQKGLSRRQRMEVRGWRPGLTSKIIRAECVKARTHKHEQNNKRKCKKALP